jgi:hypothetical protein
LTVNGWTTSPRVIDPVQRAVDAGIGPIAWRWSFASSAIVGAWGDVFANNAATRAMSMSAGFDGERADAL